MMRNLTAASPAADTHVPLRAAAAGRDAWVMRGVHRLAGVAQLADGAAVMQRIKCVRRGGGDGAVHEARLRAAACMQAARRPAALHWLSGRAHALAPRAVAALGLVAELREVDKGLTPAWAARAGLAEGALMSLRSHVRRTRAWGGAVLHVHA